ncbi:MULTISPECIES: nuclear transport factor 2 family protein [unclassified Mycolicibacterium]|uniref:nuclear transport factor 2 family protein n=1 Tax=unclassified Mycolicibacterium TaxID=2636767 RepID=UPI0012DC436C|nr:MULTISPECIES: nuclear transport factor 2 family protein [unclassified Mycolicibacterium]MUL85863.1 nuclear transport factor 2 family protein [Mycolicibacterium sp. CBMA 329]MUL90233.1 nuclear transport factor 2 family protein [Mycolicibacterium sp. CBMA 331]MUM01002.1 nuclear transport factor 2 family protein [Mycolicibacterium sp. CBMA 334]MUM29864.1 nuclear transport factor 2 family protein [Mycolicibacterium sp. CBMA 295]MUM39748.1 nuclear transport factor 2 family protein [Mycolicibacte
MVTMPQAGEFSSTAADVDSVLAWFARYDALAVSKDIDAMADEAMFPLNEVTDGSAEAVDRAGFIAQMTEQLSESTDFTMESTRTPHFINENLVFVITDATITADGSSQRVRYGDLLVKCDGDWKFQTMVQGGWGDS